jgi:galactokinase
MDYIDKSIIKQLSEGFYSAFHAYPTLCVRSSGRMELLGNHTDHQGGKVLVAAINLFMYAAVKSRQDLLVNVHSKGFPSFSIDLKTLTKQRNEMFTSAAIIRGIASKLNTEGYTIGGFDLYIESDVPPGSGVSSSAAFEMLIVEVFNQTLNQGKILPILRAKIGQFAENEYFGKPSGLLDQMGVSLGGVNFIDFQDLDHLRYETFQFPFSSLRFALIDTGGSHANLTQHYQAIRTDMEQVAIKMGGKKLSEVLYADFVKQSLTLTLPRRTLNRAKHYFEENHRVEAAAKNLKTNNQLGFMLALNQSGISSETLLENITFNEDIDQRLAKALFSLRHANLPIAVRVHGGGFAGTILLAYDVRDEKKVMPNVETLFLKKDIIFVQPVQQPIISEVIHGSK